MFHRTIVVTLFAAWVVHCSGAESPGSTEVVRVLREFYQAMGARNLDVLAEVLDTTFTVVEASQTTAKVHVINTGDKGKLLPPVGNDDWEGLKVSNVEINISSTHPSVATASFNVFHPISADHLKALKDAMSIPATAADAPRRRDAAKLIENKGRTESECAMLARRNGKWRIISISVGR